tara:strand:+ start:12213 stop:13286 length:1074 start_codon:yes stop_codon:yes gene_type:complete
MHGLQLLVNAENLADTRWSSEPLCDELAEGSLLLRVDKFALTANNITYAVAGESMRYWQFFPAPKGWGRVPVWGFATVVQSNHEAISQGERLYGYLPMGSHLMIQAGKVKAHQITDVSQHRADLPGVYNQLVRTPDEPDPDADAAQMLYRPLFMTSFLLDDFAASNDFFGATDIVLTSASSKTALGLGLLLAQRPDVRVIGVTAANNVAFVEGLGCYDQVVTYSDISHLDASRQTMSVDMAGNGDVLSALHGHYAGNLTFSCLVGATHWNQVRRGGELAGPEPQGFFAPGHIETRNWGPGGMLGAFEPAWQTMLSAVRGLIHVTRCNDPNEIEAIYQRLLAGHATPDVGYVLTVPAP